MTRFLIRILMLLVLPAPALANTAATPSYRVQPTPDWVLPQAYTVRAVPGAQTTAFLLRDTQLRLHPVMSRYHRMVLTPVSAAAVGEASSLSLEYNPAFETVQLHGIQVHRGTDRRDVTRDVKSRTLQRERSLESGIHDGLISVVFILEDIRAGDVIDFSYSIHGANPIFAGRRAGFVSVDGSIPIASRHVRILGSKARPLQLKLFNDSAELAQRTVGEWQEYRWQGNDLPAFEMDEGMPEWYAPYRWLSYSEYAGWKDVVAWAMPLYQRAVRTDPAIQALAKKLRKESANDAEFIGHALAFVQNEIRYMGLSLGDNSHRPYPADEVLRRRFGDCKDKTVLLIELLGSEGIKAYPALVSTSRGKGIGGELASHGVFDHVIVMLERGGRHYWLDGTRQYQAGSLDELGMSDYGLALPVKAGSDGLVAMYEEAEPSYIVDVVERIEASDFEGPVTLTVETRYRRNAADLQRYRYANQPVAQIARSYLDFYRQRYDDVRQDAMPEYHDDRAGNEVVIRERYTIGEYWKKSENGLHAPVRLTAFYGMVPAPQQITRTSPYAVPARRRISSTFHLKMPLKVPLKASPDMLQLEHPAFVYRGQESYVNQVYSYRSRLETRKDAVTATEIKGFSDTLRKAEKEWTFSIGIPASQGVGWSAIRKLKEQLRKGVAP